jgi:acyl-homoserine lactone synthase
MALLIMGHQLKNHPHLRDEMYRLRHRLFYEELQWDVNSNDGMEYDEFDRDDTVYIIYEEDGNIFACFRLLPTTKPYMLSEIFHELAEDYIPRASNVWELSRYCFNNPFIKNKYHFEQISASMLCTLCEFAFLHEITDLVAEMHPGLVDGAVHLYGLPHKRQKPKKFGNDDVQICHYRPAFQSIRRQAAECFGVQLPATLGYNIFADAIPSIQAAE